MHSFLRRTWVVIALIGALLGAARSAEAASCWKVDGWATDPVTGWNLWAQLSAADCTVTPAGYGWTQVAQSYVLPAPTDLWLLVRLDDSNLSSGDLVYRREGDDGKPVVYWDVIGCDDCESPIPTTSTPPERPSGANLYGVFGNGEIVEIDVRTGAASPLVIGDSAVRTALGGVTSIAYSRSDNALYLATGNGDDSLHATSLATGQTSLRGKLTNGASNIQTLDLAPAAAQARGFAADALYGISIDGLGGCNPNCFFRVDRSTGASTLIAGMQLNQGVASSFNPITGELWVFDPGGKALYTVSSTGQLTFRFRVPSSNMMAKTGVDTMFSIAHNSEGRLFGVDIAYGWLVEIDVNAQQAFVVNAAQRIRNSLGSTSLQGLDGGAP